MIGLLRFTKEKRIHLIMGPIFKLIEAIFELFLPLMMAKLIDNGINKGNTAYIYKMGGTMLLMSVLGLIAVFICQYSASIASQSFGTELRQALMKKINQFSHKEIDYFGTSTLITRTTNDINQLQIALAMLIRLVIRAPFLSIGSVIMAIYVNPKLSLVFAVLLPLFCLILYLIMSKSIPLYQFVQKKVDRLTQIVGENLSGVRVIRAFAKERKEKQRVEDASDDLAKAYIRVNNISALMMPATSLIMNVGIMIILYVGGFQVNVGHMQQGEVLALINYITQMLLAMIVVANLVVIFAKASASASRVNEVLDTEVSIKENITDNVTIDQEKTDFTGPAVRFSEVDFRYQADMGLALETISFELEKGKVLGITGPTGSGKSTLIQLIPRFYDVSHGQIEVNQEDVKEYRLNALRGKIGLVPQHSNLFTGTIAENLRWGKSDATDDEVLAALETAQAMDFIEQQPLGIETKIVEGGKNLSGGQKQRLSIARALIAKPEILILDDSLSALDYRTDLKLREALQADFKETTKIIVSQRLSSIRSADQIIVLDNGKMAGLGTHDELLETSQVYREINDSQQNADEDQTTGGAL